MDHSQLEFDFIVNGNEIGFYENQIDSSKSKIYHITKRSESMYKYFFDLYKVVKKTQYDIVHFHTQNAFLTVIDILAVRLAGVKNIVVHSHNTMDWRTGVTLKLHKVFRPILNELTSRKLACGKAAANYLYGTDKNVNILPLPVDCDKYLFNEENYCKLRKQYGVENRLVIAHTGRFSDVKNHTFLIDVFYELLKMKPESMLFLMGDGELKYEIENKVEQLGISDKVIFWGNISDVNNKLIASDIFLFPSKYEGFPTVVLEGQAAGLVSIISDTITKDICVTNLVEQIGLNESAKHWADVIYKLRERQIKRENYNKLIKDKYDISVTVNNLIKIYKELI